MANKKVEITIDDARIVAELYVDKAPEICNYILSHPGQRAIIQHAKLNGQLIFGTLPFACGFENQCRGGDLDTFDVAYYPPAASCASPTASARMSRFRSAGSDGSLKGRKPFRSPASKTG